MVWPALLPPWNRTTTSARSASQSITRPLPSSPHWAPITVTLPNCLRSPALERFPPKWELVRGPLARRGRICEADSGYVGLLTDRALQAAPQRTSLGDYRSMSHSRDSTVGSGDSLADQEPDLRSAFELAQRRLADDF